MFARSASAGVVTLPDSGAESVHHGTFGGARQPILPGQSRWYHLHRDPVVLGGCPATSAFNAGPTMRADWVP
jgi:hypothetical protein